MVKEESKETVKAIVFVSRAAAIVALLFIVTVGITISVFFYSGTGSPVNNSNSPAIPSGNTTAAIVADGKAPAASTTSRTIPADAWKAPEASTIPSGKTGDRIRYGRELIVHTADYFGPQGTVARITNGMNCQNCHLDAGSRLFANNFATFIATYPKLSGRSGKVEPASERIVECFERSLAGKAPDTTKKEMQAILAYMKWIGQSVKKRQELFGSASEKLAFIDHAADPAKGKEVYMLKCQSCHGNNGEGILSSDKKSYANPPLWGKHSFNDGAGMYRITNLAGFVKNNMPYGATYQNPQLTDEEAWNVAAFIESRPRPHKDQHNDWKDLKKKPIDFPFGPYADRYSEKQHKYGPFQQIKDSR